eukprot:6482283-Amphidinium_carterae.1
MNARDAGIPCPEQRAGLCKPCSFQDLAPMRSQVAVERPSGVGLVHEEDYLMAWQRSVVERLGITWPPPKRRPGKPQRR